MRHSVTLRHAQMEARLDTRLGRVTLIHRATGGRWELDERTALGDTSGVPLPRFGDQIRVSAPEWHSPLDPCRNAQPFDTCVVTALDERAVEWTREGQGGRAVFRYELNHEGLRITLLADRSTVTACAVPGAFRPEGSVSPPVVIPRNQGVWHRGTGAPFAFHWARTGHDGWSMPFFAVIGAREALLTILEDEHDARIWFERTPQGEMRAACLQLPSKGRLAYSRRVLLRFVPPDVTAIAKTYRQYAREHGAFRSWDEKIAERPLVERLFGALMCFIGYCRNDTLDYAAGFRALKAMGFERAFVYPLSFGNVREGFPMGGRPPIDIRRHLPLLEELGYLAASWMWVNDVPPERADLRLDAQGKESLSWKIDDLAWYAACPVRQPALSHRIQDERMGGHTAHHFDVTANLPGVECWHPEHPLDRREEALWRRKVLETATGRGLVVSSEGFWGYATPSYDIGSVKLAAAVRPDWYAVPLTSLVYHDACIHDWWEADNYNNARHAPANDPAYFPIRAGGQPALQATQDALAGWPPNVFPFGTQYGWVNECWGESYAYTHTLDQPDVQTALRIALPVARLHGRIGRLECVAHQTLTPDGAVQASTFADGTRVVANFAERPMETDDAGILPPVSWRVLEQRRA